MERYVTMDKLILNSFSAKAELCLLKISIMMKEKEQPFPNNLLIFVKVAQTAGKGLMIKCL